MSIFSGFHLAIGAFFVGLFYLNPPVATVMGKPLSKAPDGGYYEIVRVTEDATQSGLQQGPETSVLVEQRVPPEAFPTSSPMSVQ